MAKICPSFYVGCVPLHSSGISHKLTYTGAVSHDKSADLHWCSQLTYTGAVSHDKSADLHWCSQPWQVSWLTLVQSAMTSQLTYTGAVSHDKSADVHWCSQPWQVSQPTLVQSAMTSQPAFTGAVSWPTQMQSAMTDVLNDTAYILQFCCEHI